MVTFCKTWYNTTRRMLTFIQPIDLTQTSPVLLLLVSISLCVCTQAYIVLLCFADSVFFFYKLKVCDNPAVSKPHFSTTCANFVSLCHILVILKIFQAFSLPYLLWRSVVSNFLCFYCSCFEAP